MTKLWSQLLFDEFQKDYMVDLLQFVKLERENYTIYPKDVDVFSAFNLTDYDNVKVVILGQDPYHQPNQAHGLAFSVSKDSGLGDKLPPSLRNIFKEMENEGFSPNKSGDLTYLANQGVLLFNTVFTVREGLANSHAKKGWEKFSDYIISLLNDRPKPIIFVLWGKPAQSKIKLIDDSKHIIITAPHPSPLSASRGFFGCDNFITINHQLKNLGQEPIVW